MNQGTTRHTIKSCIVFLLLASFLLLLSQPQITLAEDEDPVIEQDQDFVAYNSDNSDSYITFAQEESYPDERNITVPFYSMKDILTWQFPYSDLFFTVDSGEFRTELAKASIGLAISAFRNNELPMENQNKTYLGRAGFSNIYTFGYDQETDEDTLSGVIAMKKIGDFTLIAAAPCGQGYKKEWASNLKVGDVERHVGFNEAAQILEGYIKDYIEEYQITGEKKFWISGFSRAAAVSNLTAADMIASGEFSDVYAYLFGVPRTTRAPVKYKGIYNICGGFDPVTWFPLEQWGFARYGTDVFTPVQEVNSDYVEYVAGADRVNRLMQGSPFINSPYINYQLHLIVEFLGALFPTSADYAEQFQAILMETWKEFNPDTMIEMVVLALDKLDDLDKRESYAVGTFVEYLSLLGAQQLRGNQELIESGQWDKNASIGVNYMREHMPYTYVNWLFSENAPEKLFSVPAFYRRIILVGPIDVYVYQNEELIGSVERNGKISQVNQWEGNEDLFVSELFLHRSKNETSIVLPIDKQYDLEIYMNRPGSLLYYQVFGSHEQLSAPDGIIYQSTLKKGLYGLTFDPSKFEPSDLTAHEGKILESYSYPYEYNPFVVMATELTNTKSITLGSSLTMAFGIVVFLCLLGLVNLIIAIVHAIRKKKRPRPYSNLYVIIPHCLLIALFALLTQFMTLNLVTIGIMKSACAGLTVFCIFMLGLRGLLRCIRGREERGYRSQAKKKKIIGVIYLAFLAGACVLSYMFYKVSPLASYSTGKALLYYGITLLLTVGSILLFPNRLPKEKKQVQVST